MCQLILTISICSLYKEGVELQKRVECYKNALGKDSETIVSTLDSRITELNNAKERINQDMSDIWDDLFNVKNADDVEDLIERIGIVLKKGLAPADQSGLSELQDNLNELFSDIKKVREATGSRNEFMKLSKEVQDKYEESDFDFEVQPIIADVIKDIAKELEDKENSWKKENLSLGDKTRAAVHKWKEKIKFLPEYLSEDTIAEVNRLDREAEDIISVGKIDDVVFYFEKLDKQEKEHCLSRLKRIVNEEHEISHNCVQNKEFLDVKKN